MSEKKEQFVAKRTKETRTKKPQKLEPLLPKGSMILTP